MRCDKTTQSVIVTNLTENLRICPLVTSGLNVEILEGQISPTYGVKVKAPIVRFRKKGEVPITFVTVLYPYRNDSPNIQISQIDVHGKDWKILDESEATGIKIDFERHEDYFASSHAKKRECALFEGSQKRKGRVIFLRNENMKAVKEIIL